MDFSEYTLVSFGDSFTAGQGLEKDPSKPFQSLTSFWPKPRGEYNAYYFDVTRNSGYTSLLSKKLNFKKYHNLGLEGISNEKTLLLLRDFIYSRKKDEKYFVLVNFTQPQRENLYSTHQDGPGMYDVHTTPLTFENLRKKPGVRWNLANMPEKSIQEYYTYISNNTYLFYKFIEIFYSIKKELESENIPYIMFDVLNDMQLYGKRVKHCNARILPYRYDDIVDDTDARYRPFMTGDYSEFDYYLTNKWCKNYIETKFSVSDKSKVHIDKYKNLFDSTSIYAHFEGTSSKVPDGHWNKHGHRIATEILYDFIKEKYGQ